MSDSNDEIRSSEDAALIAARVLSGLADLLRHDDPEMPSREQREKKAALLDSVAGDLLTAHGLDDDALRYASEWTANLSHLLGINQRQQAAGVRHEV